MDNKRLSLALVLAAAVVVLTQILFPTPRRVNTPVTAVRDTVNNKPVQASVSADTGVAARVVNSSLRDTIKSVDVPPTAGPVRPEITTVATKNSTYRFTNMGAAPVSVVVSNYRNLAPSGGLVELKAAGQPLLRYSIVTQGDTLSLDRVPFALIRPDSTAEAQSLNYTATVNGLPIRISYDFVPGTYVVNVNGRIEGAKGSTYLLTELPSTLPAAESDTLGDLRTLAYSFKPTRENASGVPFSKLEPGTQKLEPGPLSWVAVRNKYFVVGLINPQGSNFSELTLKGGPRTSKTATNASATVVKSLPEGQFAFEMYAGPQQSTQLLAVGRDFDNVNPYGWSFLQGVVNPIAALCLKLLLWMHDNLKLTYGWVLVIFGVLVRIALWPLNQSAMRSSLKMQEIQPRLAEVQKRYKDKPEKQREEMMKVYKEAGASPFTALSGCLPALIPMPVLFALFFVFQNTIEFRGVPFLWLLDISVKDPFYILPVLMGASMFVLSWIGLRNAPPNPQAKMMGYMFPVMMVFFLANMASGLNLYYTAQNIAALPQQWLLARERAKNKRPA